MGVFWALLTYFWQVTEKGVLIFSAKKIEKAREFHFLCVSGKNKTKNFFQQKFSRGSLIFGGLKKISSPPPINNEPSLRDLSLFTGMGAGDLEGAAYFGKSPMGGIYFWRQNFLKARETHFLRVSGKNKT